MTVVPAVGVVGVLFGAREDDLAVTGQESVCKRTIVLMIL